MNDIKMILGIGSLKNGRLPINHLNHQLTKKVVLHFYSPEPLKHVFY